MSIKIEKNPKWTNSPGEPKTVYIRTDSSLLSLYYATYSAASSGGVTQNINDRIFACTYSIYDYSFVGNSGKKISTDTIHYMSFGLYGGVWTQPDTSQVRPTIYYSPSGN